MNKEFVIQITNLLHLLGISLPAVVFYNTEFTGILEPLICGSLVLIISLFSGFLWAKSIQDFGYFEKKVSAEKDLAFKTAYEVCFSNLWLIPNRSLISTSNAKWSLTIKDQQPTVRSVMIASIDSLYLIIGGMVLACIYMAYGNYFGISLTKISNLVGGYKTIQMALIMISPWVALVYLFNWHFHQFSKWIES